MLPNGFTQKRFETVLAAFRAIVGDDWVFSSAEDLHTYRDFYSPYWGEESERRTSAAVAPASVEEVQRIVKIANEHRLPLFPFSGGKNLGYGGSAPNLSGCVALDLKRMNRILEIDEKRQFVLVEPGVTYFDLYRHIQEKGLKLWIDCPAPGWGSLVGNALDRGTGYTVSNMRDHFGAHCGMEVVLPNGDLVRTGMGARDGSGSWQDYRYGVGPYVDGLFSQGNYGVVTKMGFWLYPQPDGALCGSVIAPHYHDIIALTQILTRLENLGVINGTPFFTSPVIGTPPGMPKNSQLQQLLAKGGATPAEFDALAQGRPYWKLRLPFIGPHKVVEAQWEYAKEQFASIPGVKFEDVARYSFPLSAEQTTGLSMFKDEWPAYFGIPSLEIFMVGARTPFNPHGSHGIAWLAPIMPRTGETVIKAHQVLVRAMLEHGVFQMENAPMPLCYTPRSFTMMLPFLISEDTAQNKRTRETMSRLIDVAAEQGWLEYRAHTIFQDQIMSQYNFNNNALRRFHETLKEAIDPNGIIAPGRYAIWPKTMRGEKNR